MQVTADIRRSDLIRLSLHLLPRTRSNLIFVGVLAVGIFLYILVTRRPDTVQNVLLAAVASISGGIGGLIGGFVCSQLFILFTSNEKNGVLGKHTYTLKPEGLHESTTANESLQKWAGIHAIEKSKNYIYIRISGHLFHVIPRRAFNTDQDFSSFWERTNALWKQAAV